MSSTKYNTGQFSALRKSKVEGKPSMLPKPRPTGSTDRASMEARRPSAAPRSSSAEPVRGTFAGPRLSREASASKIPINRRSRSQQGESRYGQFSMTPLRSTNMYPRTTATPVRTPSEERRNRCWQTCLERALAFVTIKDQRPISSVAWQRAEYNRVQEGLAARSGGEGAATLIRPLTIAQFVNIAGGLLNALNHDTKYNSDNYVAKFPNMAKRFLYPGAVSKSWLKTVNTLHAFPHALAFIVYFLDLVNHFETPVSEEWLYVDKSDVAALRRDYLYKSWVRFQQLSTDFEDLREDYLQQLRELAGHDPQHKAELMDTIDKCKATLEDETELAARAAEERLRTRRDALAASLKAGRAERRDLQAALDEEYARRTDQASAARALDNDIATITAETQQLKKELEEQTISVSERARMLDDVDYNTRVIDSKRTLADQLSATVLSKERELASWQKRTLASCVQYKHALIKLAARQPELATLAVDEKELMHAECATAVSRAVNTLRALAQQLGDLRAGRARERTALARQRLQQLEEIRAKVAEIQANIERVQQALDCETAREHDEAAAWAAERQTLAAQLEALRAAQQDYGKVEADLEFWEQQDLAWRTKLSEMEDYITSLREDIRRRLEAEKRSRAEAVKAMVRSWHHALDEVEAQEREAEEMDRGRRDVEEAGGSEIDV